VKVADHLAGRMDLDRVLRPDVSVDDSSADDDRRHLDLGVHLGPVPDDERIVALDLALEDAVDTNAPLEMELPLELSAASEQGRDLGGRELLFHAVGPTRPWGRQATPGRTRRRASWRVETEEDAGPETDELTGDLGWRHPAGGHEVFHRPSLPLIVSSVGLLALVGSPCEVRAQEVGPSREELASAVHRPIDKDQSDNPLRGSALFLEQSMTTQTARLNPAEQSYVPLYEIWLSFRPRYYFNQHWSVRGRFDYTKELTNDQTTTYYREDVFGDIWTDLVYSSALDTLWPGTKVSVGVRALWPTSKASQANGTYVTLGALAGAVHKFEIRGEEAPTFNNFHVGLSFTYLHPFSNATTPTSYGDFQYTRQDVGDDNRSIISDQISGTTLVDHSLLVVLDTGVQITPKLSLSLDDILINQWHYAPTGSGIVTTTGPVNPTLVGDTQYTPSNWVIVGLDYTLFDELALGLGYYSVATQIAPDGQRRTLFGSDNLFWSPDARVFFSITANLDAVFDDAVHHRYSLQQAAQDQRVSHVTGGM
jgi:hypothetical protein